MILDTPWRNHEICARAEFRERHIRIVARRAPGTDSQFDFGVTHDRRRIIPAARCLMRQLGLRPGAD